MITQYRIGETMSDEDSLAHFGVKGMKWGQRKAPDSSGVTRSDARQQIRDSNKSTTRKLEDWNDSTSWKTRDKRNADIKDARKGKRQANRDFADKKSEIKSQKKAGTIGKNAARVALAKANNERFETLYKAQQKTSGEAALALIFSAAQLATR